MQGSGFWDITPSMDNQTQKTLEHEMDTGFI